MEECASTYLQEPPSQQQLLSVASLDGSVTVDGAAPGNGRFDLAAANLLEALERLSTD